MGMFPDLFAGTPELIADPMGRKWYALPDPAFGYQTGAQRARRARKAKTIVQH